VKLLLDQNISFRVIKSIEKIFVGSEQVRRIGLENSTDKDIWSYAKANGFTIVTFDSDFNDLSLLHGQPPKVIWIRMRNISTDNLIDVLNDKVSQIKLFIDDDVLSCLQIEDSQ
jgi:predicted nuclease of predicted toxin-antitoxin system